MSKRRCETCGSVLDDDIVCDSFTKVTVGFVVQSYVVGSDGIARCTSQEFVASDEVTYEDAEGNQIKDFSIGKEAFCPFDMRQPCKD